VFVDALAAQHHSHERERYSFKLQLAQLENERANEKKQVAQAMLDYKSQLQKETELRDLDLQQHARELEASAAQLAEAKRCGDEAVAAVSEDAAALAQMRIKFEEAERRLEDAEVTHAELLQRTMKAENLCRQLTAKIDEKDEQLKRTNEDREGLLGEVDRRQQAERALAEMSETLREKDARLVELEQQQTVSQRERASLVEAREKLQVDLQRAFADMEEQKSAGQRRLALLDARAEDLGRRLASSITATRAAELARDDAMREASWLRCELATVERLGQDRDARCPSSHSNESNSWRQSLTLVEKRLRERAEQAHSDALEMQSSSHPTHPDTMVRPLLQ